MYIYIIVQIHICRYGTRLRKKTPHWGLSSDLSLESEDISNHQLKTTHLTFKKNISPNSSKYHHAFNIKNGY
jgi:hypothetical protein